MTVEDIQQICNKFPAVTEDIKWENHLCFCVGGKIFLILGMDETPVTASFKVLDEEFEEMAARTGFAPAPYLARYKWVWASNIAQLSKKEWEHYIKQSYEWKKTKLTAKVRRELGLV
ncbi:MAG: hypothetical protein COA57_08645 [Flavobacteriales bacterium]|nr:MAG: hypothetical protein COA57_08645 [Flavobacteriales bacterium]